VSTYSEEVSIFSEKVLTYSKTLQLI